MPLNDYLPDPTKWIDTAPSSSSKTLQRPLVAFKHGIATPPTSLPRRVGSTRQPTTLGLTSGSKPSRIAATVTETASKRDLATSKTPRPAIGGNALSRQTSIGVFFTPPQSAAGPSRRRAAGSDEKTEAENRLQAVAALGADSTSGPRSGAARRDGGKGKAREAAGTSKLKMSTRNDWGSSDTDEPLLPPRYETLRPRSTRSDRSPPTTISPTGLAAFSSGELSDLPDEYLSDPASPPPRRKAIPQIVPAIPSSLLGTQVARARASAERHFSPASPARQSSILVREPQAAAPPAPAASIQLPTPSLSTPPMPSSQLDLPVVPDSVMRIHARLCGQNEERMRRIKSPWKKRERDRDGAEGSVDDLPPPTESVKSAKPDVAFEEAKRRRGGSLVKRFVPSGEKRKGSRALVCYEDLDDSQGPDQHSTSALAALQPNIPRPRSIEGAERSSKRQRLGRHLSDRVAKPPTPRSVKPSRTVISPRVSAHPAPAQLHPASRSTPSSRNDGSPRTTPRKRSSPKHHTVTPPKTSPRDRARNARSDVDLPFGSPPPQPVFWPASDSGERKRRKEWQAVDMEAETLLTWSLGPGARSHTKQLRERSAIKSEPHPLDLIAEQDFTLSPLDPEMMDGPSRPRAEKRDSATTDTTETQSLAPSALSQDFVRLLSSPDRAHDGVNGADLPAEEAASGPAEAAHSPPKSSAAPADPASVTSLRSAGWRALERGILSMPVNATPKSQAKGKAPGPSGHEASSSSSAKRPKVGPEDPEGQPKLAAFGFFAVENKPDSGSRLWSAPTQATGFERAWDEEEDLNLGDPGDDPGDPTPIMARSVRSAGGKPLSKVPDAPYHPYLRPAGVREMRRRAEARERRRALEKEEEVEGAPSRERNREKRLHDHTDVGGNDAAHPLRNGLVADAPSTAERDLDSPSALPLLPVLGSSDSSSLSTDLDLPKLGEEAARWWAGIGERSSEAGSLG